jgi:hypothetical protein
MAYRRKPKPDDHREMPFYWFAVLETARERNDFEQAAEAVRQLRRLGVTVRYGRPQQQGERQEVTPCQS